MESKPFWKSKTFWFNAVGIAQLVLPMAGIPTIPMDADTTGMVVTAGNILLRTVTNSKVTLSSS